MVEGKILVGDAKDHFDSLSDESVHACITSPPYWKQRTYLAESHPDRGKEIGGEASPEEYVSNLLKVFGEVRRVLRKDGTFWLNIGDKYHQGQLLGLPWRVAFALKDQGWRLRAAAPWIKKCARPDAAKNRPGEATEMIFLFSKSKSYYYDWVAVRRPGAGKGNNKGTRHLRTTDWFFESLDSSIRLLDEEACYLKAIRHDGGMMVNDDALPIAFVVNPKSYPGAHTATFPPELIRPMVLASTSDHGVCSSCGSQYNRIIKKGDPNIDQQKNSGANNQGSYAGSAQKDYKSAGAQDASALKARILAGMRNIETIGWEVGCRCNAEKAPARILDPFFGAGTVGVVATEEHRHWTGLEIYEEFAKNSMNRIRETRMRVIGGLGEIDLRENQMSLFEEDI